MDEHDEERERRESSRNVRAMPKKLRKLPKIRTDDRRRARSEREFPRPGSFFYQTRSVGTS